MSVPALIIDIGGGSLKVGFAGDERPKIIDNCIFKSRTLSGRTFIGDEIDDCENLSSLYYIMPFKKLPCFRLNPSKNPILREYVLPDYAEVPRGYIRIPNQECTSLSDLYAPPIPKRSTQQGYVLRLSNERFTVPELLFHPGDVGFRDMGLTEAMGYLMCERLPPAVRPGAWANILVIGGSTCFPGFLDRLKVDLRCLPPDDLAVNIFMPNNPRTYAWEGGSLLAQTKDDFTSYLVTRAEYDEGGSAYCERRFPVS
ncbi:unnamed protein product [Dicrocoelium dendriticum]|nr:unnamed protein product [Dicrocoelium dendriticum]